MFKQHTMSWNILCEDLDVKLSLYIFTYYLYNSSPVFLCKKEINLSHKIGTDSIYFVCCTYYFYIYYVLNS